MPRRSRPLARRERLTANANARPQMMRSLVLVAALAGVNAGAVELTKSNFKELVADSGKAAFVKFLAPW